MKNLKKSVLVLAVAMATIFSSCSKSEPAVIPAPAAAADGFTWTENGGTTVMTGYTPAFVNQGHSLFVHTASGAQLFEFNFNSLAPATNVLGGATYNPGAVFYVDYQFAGVTNTNKFVPTSGTCIISSNANNKISATFTASGSTGTISSIKGAFNNILVN